MLLIINDAWQIEDALAFRVGNTSCSYLLTSRFVDLAHQWAREDVSTVPELDEAEALSLLSTLAPYAVEAAPESTREILRAVGGLPLAITLLGNYLQVQTHSQQARRLQATLDRLRDIEVRLRLAQSLAPLEQPPHLSAETPIPLHATIEVSDQFLDEQSRAAFYALSVLPAKPASFSEEAALAIACVDVAVLDHLHDIGLLESKGQDRYMLHQTIADYARIHLESVLPAERLIEYVIAFVEAHPSQNELLAQESDIISTALETAYTLNDHARLIRGVFTLVPFFIAQGESLTLARQREDRERTARFLMNIGVLVHARGDHTQAETYWREELALVRKIGHRELQCGFLLKSG